MNSKRPQQLSDPTTAGPERPQATPPRHASLFPPDLPTITHARHPILQRLHRLRRREAREASGLYYIEGLRVVFQAVAHRAPIEALVVCHPLLTNIFAQRLVRRQRQLGVPIRTVTPPVMGQRAPYDSPIGLRFAMITDPDGYTILLSGG